MKDDNDKIKNKHGYEARSQLKNITEQNLAKTKPNKKGLALIFCNNLIHHYQHNKQI